MKLRRVSAAVATTAVLAPAALLAAPVAHAAAAAPVAPPASTAVVNAAGQPSVTEGPSTAPSPSTGPSTPAPEPGGDGTAPGNKPDEPASGGAGADTGAGKGDQPGEKPGKANDSKPGENAGTGNSGPADGSTEGNGAQDAQNPSKGSGELDECADDEVAEDPELSTTLDGLPSKVIAGSGFHAFTYKVTNRSDRAYKRVDFGVFAGIVHDDDLENTGRYLTLQFKNPDTDAWENVSTDDTDEDAGYIGFTDVRPHETLSLDLRLSVAKEAPEGLGFALSVGAYVDENGACFLSTGDYYEFEVLKAGTEPVKVPGAKPEGHKPQGGQKPLPTRPVGNKEINPAGSLAETGSSDILPTFALAGAAAVAIGAGAVFAVRRRKAGDAEA